MEENKNLMNTNVSDLTVKEVLLVNLVAPIVMIGGVVIMGTLYGVGQTAVDKFKAVRENRKNKSDKK